MCVVKLVAIVWILFHEVLIAAFVSLSCKKGDLAQVYLRPRFFRKTFDLPFCAVALVPAMVPNLFTLHSFFSLNARNGLSPTFMNVHIFHGIVHKFNHVPFIFMTKAVQLYLWPIVTIHP